MPLLTTVCGIEVEQCIVLEFVLTRGAIAIPENPTQLSFVCHKSRLTRFLPAKFVAHTEAFSQIFKVVHHLLYFIPPIRKKEWRCCCTNLPARTRLKQAFSAMRGNVVSALLLALLSAAQAQKVDVKFYGTTFLHYHQCLQ
jgi:hypothetical protein